MPQRRARQARRTVPDERVAALATVLQALEIIHHLDPLGVGARDLRECLLIQIGAQRREAEMVLRRAQADAAQAIYGLDRRVTLWRIRSDQVPGCGCRMLPSAWVQACRLEIGNASPCRRAEWLRGRRLRDCRAHRCEPSGAAAEEGHARADPRLRPQRGRGAGCGGLHPHAGPAAGAALQRESRRG